MSRTIVTVVGRHC